MSFLHRVVLFVHNSVQACPRLTKFSLHRPRRVDVEFSDGNVQSFCCIPQSRALLQIAKSDQSGLRSHIWSAIMSGEPVGNYGVRIIFYDLHQTGIDTSDYLYELGGTKFTLMKKYIRTPKKHGLGRDPRPRK